jgi:hypothetical protein
VLRFAARASMSFDVLTDRFRIKAAKSADVFYGCQTLRLLRDIQRSCRYFS